MNRLLTLFLILALSVCAVAQQAQTSTAPLSLLNAKYTNGVAPGYWPTNGSGLTLNLSGGTVSCNGTIQTYTASTLTMTASTTNYVYLAPASSCVPATKTTSFVLSDIPIAVVVTGSSSITSITDDRTHFISKDQLDELVVPAANCNGTTAGSGWSIGSGATVTCRAGTNNLGGYVAITDTSTSFAQFYVRLPLDWDANIAPYISFQFAYPGTDGSSSHTIIPQVKVSCLKGDGSTTDDVTFEAAHSANTITLTSATPNLYFDTASVQFNSTDMTGCIGG